MKKLLLLLVLFSTFISQAQVTNGSFHLFQSWPTSMTTNDGVTYYVERSLNPGTASFGGAINIPEKWGGLDFPSGVASEDPKNIIISKAGTYFVTFNKETLAYNFTDVDSRVCSLVVDSIDQQGVLGCGDNDSVTLSASISGNILPANLAYQWTTTDGEITDSTVEKLTVTKQGTYDLKVIDLTNGCEAEATITLEQSIAPVITEIGKGFPFLGEYGPNLELTPKVEPEGPSYTYTWTGPDDSFVSGIDPSKPQINKIGTYKLVVKNPVTGCTSSEYSIEVEHRTISIIGYALTGTADGWNQGQDVLMTTTDGINYELKNQKLYAGGLKFRQGQDWTINWGGTSFETGTGIENSADDIPVEAGIYTIRFNLDTKLYIFEDQCPAFTISQIGKLDCSPTAQVQLLPSIPLSEGDTYTWYSEHEGFPKEEVNLTVSKEGEYKLIISNDICGTRQDTIHVKRLEGPSIDIVSPPKLGKKDTTITLKASGPATGVSYKWTGPEGAIIENGNTLTPKVNRVGTYKLTATYDDSKCFTEKKVIVEYYSIRIFGINSLNQLWEKEMTTTNGVDYELKTSPDEGYELEGKIVYFKNEDIKLGGISFPWGIATEELSEINIDEQETTYFIKFDRSNNEYYFGLKDEPIPHRDCQASVEIEQPEDIGCSGEVTISTTLNNFNDKVKYVLTASDGTVTNPTITEGSKFKISEAGTYDLKVFDLKNGCEANATVTVNAAETIITIEIENPSKFLGLGADSSSLILKANLTPSDAEYKYQWKKDSEDNNITGADTSALTVSEVGKYTLMVQDLNTKCEATKSIEISYASISIIDSALGDEATKVDMETENGFEYIIENQKFEDSELQFSQDDKDVITTWGLENVLEGIAVEGQKISLNQGVYTVTFNLRTKEFSFKDKCPSIVFEQEGSIDCSGGVVTLSATDLSGRDYEWICEGKDDFLKNGASIDVTEAGTYTLTVRDTNALCDDTVKIFEVTDNLTKPSVVFKNVDSVFLEDATVGIVLDATGSSTGSYNYEWLDPNGVIIPGADSLTLKVNAVGKYKLQITNNVTKCSAIDSIEVKYPSVSIWGTAVSDKGFGHEMNSLDGDLYTLEVSSLEGYSLMEGDLYFLVDNKTVKLGGISFPIGIAKENTQHIDTKAGKYFIKFKRSTGEYHFDTVNTPFTEWVCDFKVNKSDNPLVINCEVSEVTLALKESLTNVKYEWKDPNGGPIADATPNVVVSSPGVYTLKVTDLSNGCETNVSFDVSENMETPEISFDDPKFYDGEPFKLNAYGSSEGEKYTITWTATDGGVIESGASTLQPEVSAVGKYNLTITHNISKCSVSLEKEVVTKPSEFIKVKIVNSDESEVLMTTEDGNFYTTSEPLLFKEDLYFTISDTNLIYGGVSFPLGKGTTDLSTIKVTKEGLYFVAFNRLNKEYYFGLTKVNSIPDFECELFKIEKSDNPLVINCATPKVTLSLKDNTMTNVRYEWKSPTGEDIPGDNPSITVSDGGDYLLKVTDLAKGCVEEVTFTVEKDNTITDVSIVYLNVKLSKEVNELDLNGIIDPIGLNYKYSWSWKENNQQNAVVLEEQTSKIITVNKAGIYVLSVTNLDTGCVSTSEPVEVIKEVELEQYHIATVFTHPHNENNTGVLTTTDNIIYEVTYYFEANEPFQIQLGDTTWGGEGVSGTAQEGANAEFNLQESGNYIVKFNVFDLGYSFQKIEDKVTIGNHELQPEVGTTKYQATAIDLEGTEQFEVNTIAVPSQNTLPSGNAQEEKKCEHTYFKGKYDVTFDTATYQYSYELKELAGTLSEIYLSVAEANGSPIKYAMSPVAGKAHSYYSAIQGNLQDITMQVESKETNNTNHVLHAHQLDLDQGLSGNIAKSCTKDYANLKVGKYIVEVDYQNNTYTIIENPKVQIKIGDTQLIDIPQIDNQGNYSLTKIEIQSGEQLKLISKSYGEAAAEYDLNVIGTVTPVTAVGNNTPFTPGYYDISYNSEKSEYKIELKESTAEEIISKHGLVTIYPNPSADKLHIALQSGDVLRSVKVYTLLSKLIREFEGSDIIDTIEVSDWAKGMYLLEITTDRGTVVIKFMKN